jgi:hypothetical protein
LRFFLSALNLSCTFRCDTSSKTTRLSSQYSVISTPNAYRATERDSFAGFVDDGLKDQTTVAPKSGD